MADAHTNFAGSLVATAPSPASSGTSLVVTATEGALFPAVPFNATVWPVNTQPTAANAEIVRVTARASDTFTITRAQEGSSARTVIVGDQICATVTALTLTDVEATGQMFGAVISPAQLTADTNDWNPTGLATASEIRFSTDATRSITGIAAPSQGGRTLILANVGSFNANLVNASTLSSAANRFACGGAADDVLPIFPNQTVMMVYNATGTIWRVFTVANKGAAQPLNPAAAGVAGTSRYYSSEDHQHAFPTYVATSTYTPTLTQSGTVTKTVTYAHYWQIGKLVVGWVALTVTGSGSAGTRILVGLPVTAVSASIAPIGAGEVYDSSVTTPYRGIVYFDTTTAVALYLTDATTLSTAIGANPSVALASGDVVDLYFMYEAA